jgi:hypothetical protein
MIKILDSASNVCGVLRSFGTVSFPRFSHGTTVKVTIWIQNDRARDLDWKSALTLTKAHGMLKKTRGIEPWSFSIQIVVETTVRGHRVNNWQDVQSLRCKLIGTSRFWLLSFRWKWKISRVWGNSDVFQMKLDCLTYYEWFWNERIQLSRSFSCNHLRNWVNLANKILQLM